MTGEVWSLVPGDAAYEVSSLGKVRSLGRQVRCGRGHRVIPARILQPTLLDTGYLQVQLSGRKKVAVHRLVALAFIPVVPGADDVNHKNGKKVDNRYGNLEWVTPAENLKHSFEVLGRVGSCTGKLGGDHPASKAIIATCMRTGAERRFESGMDAVREGFDSSSISRCCNGVNAYHKGRTWRFAC